MPLYDYASIQKRKSAAALAGNRTRPGRPARGPGAYIPSPRIPIFPVKIGNPMSKTPLDVAAVTPLLKRFEQWRIENGRDPRTGRRVRPGRPLQRCDVDPRYLIVMALRMAAQQTGRDDLRPMYLELARIFEGSNEQP